jgi:hypothetical protein
MTAGILPDAALSYLCARAIDSTIIGELGIVEHNGRLIYPNGRSIALNGNGPKARQPAGVPLELWWPHGEPDNGATVIVCEGESDALAVLSMIGLSKILYWDAPADDPLAGLVVAAMPGTGYPAGRLADDLAGVGVAVLSFDGDDAGHKATMRAAEALSAARIGHCDLAVPDGSDIAGHLASLGPDDRVPWLAGAIRDARPPERAADIPPVDAPETAALLSRIGRFVRRFVILPSVAEYRAVALFVLHTWAFDAAHATPYIVVESPEKQSGKTRLLEVLDLVCRDAVKVASITSAGLFQTIGDGHPTFLIDEADAIFAGNTERCEDLRGVLNAGNAPGSVVRRGGKDGKPISYDVYCPKVIAGIATGRLPDTIRDRAIIIPIDRKLRTERVERLRRRLLLDELDGLRGELAAWAGHHHDYLTRYDLPEPLEKISDRLEEAWEPLLAIADLAGGDWPLEARNAAEGLASGDVAEEDSNAGHRLLIALQDIFDGEAMATKDIVAALNADDEFGFASWHDGKGLSGRDLGRLLKRYRIRSRAVRLPDGQNLKGYQREWFAGAWERYGRLSSVTSVTTAAQSQKQGVADPSQDAVVTDGEEAANPHGIRVVTDVTANGHGDAELERLRAKFPGMFGGAS